jgi:predicted nucleic acid-binding protein
MILCDTNIFIEFYKSSNLWSVHSTHGAILSHKLAIPDALIAATALVNDQELYTQHKRLSLY